jgi:hypothetical protein
VVEHAHVCGFTAKPYKKEYQMGQGVARAFTKCRTMLSWIKEMGRDAQRKGAASGKAFP